MFLSGIQGRTNVVIFGQDSEPAQKNLLAKLSVVDDSAIFQSSWLSRAQRRTWKPAPNGLVRTRFTDRCIDHTFNLALNCCWQPALTLIAQCLPEPTNWSNTEQKASSTSFWDWRASMWCSSCLIRAKYVCTPRISTLTVTQRINLMLRFYKICL